MAEPHIALAPAGVLNSWKEISAYVGRGVRTVQRWERELQFPVRRPYGKKRSTVIAVPAEIDSWLHPPVNGNGKKATQPVRLDHTRLDSNRSRLLHGAEHLRVSVDRIVANTQRAIALGKLGKQMREQRKGIGSLNVRVHSNP